MSYSDEYIKRTLRLVRVAEGEFAESAKVIKKLKRDVKTSLGSLSLDDSGKSRARVIGEISQLFNNSLSNMSEASMEVAEEIVTKEIAWHTDTLAKYTAIDIAIPSTISAISEVRNLPFQGRTFKDWYKGLELVETDKATKIVETGIMQGQSVSQITAEVAAAVGKTGYQIRSLVRSQVISTANRAREIVVEQNSDLFSGKIWVSTLDMRTTVDICGIRDQLQYTMDNQPIGGHGTPWLQGPGLIHFNCRSTFIPEMIGVDTSTSRPSVGAGKEYQRGDNLTTTGKVRKPTKQNRDDGIFKIKQKAAGTKYEEWLRTQPKDFVADVLGSAKKAQIFKKGRSLASVTSNPFGTNLTTTQL